MTELSVALQEHLRKANIDWNGDLLREGMTLLPRLLIEHEVGQQIGAARHDRREGRQTCCDAFRDGIRETREGEIPLRIPCKRENAAG